MTKQEVTLSVDDHEISVPVGWSILQAAEEYGIHIPTLCYHKDLSPTGACRMCVVEVERQRTLQAACSFPVSNGLVVHTHSPQVVEARKAVLELLLTDHPNDCIACEVNGDCQLQDLVYEYGVEWPTRPGDHHHYAVDSDPNPFVRADFNKCILCTRCVRACAEVQGRHVWNVAYRGFDARIVAGAETTMQEARCEFCGNCVGYCPVGALYDKMSVRAGRAYQLKKVTTTCAYCGVGCNLDLNVRDNRLVRVTSNFDAPVNGAALCVKGRYGYDFVHHPDRLTAPLIRETCAARRGRAAPVPGTGVPMVLHRGRAREHSRSNGQFHQATWDEALDLTATRLAQIKRESGGDAIAVLTSAKCTNEENYLMQKFTRQVIGTNNVDHCARL